VPSSPCGAEARDAAGAVGQPLPRPAPGAGSGFGQRAVAVNPPPPAAEGEAAAADPTLYTAWAFGELPELMEMRRGSQVLVGFPALIDRATPSRSRSSTSQKIAAAKHRAGCDVCGAADP